MSRIAVQVSAGRDAQFCVFRLGAGVGGDVEAAGGRQAETKVVGPLYIQREAAVDVERKTRQVEIERDVSAGGQQRLPQRHIELDRVGIGRQRAAQGPVGNLDAVLVVPGGLDIGDVDCSIAVAVEQDLGATGAKQVVQRGFDNADGAALTRELGLEVS